MTEENKEWNLSNERMNDKYTKDYFYDEADIKKAIKLLKEEIENELGHNVCINLSWRAIDKIMGEKLK